MDWYFQMTSYGDLSYLLSSTYDSAMRMLIGQAKRISMQDLRLYGERELKASSSTTAAQRKSIQVGLLCLLLN